VKEKMRARLHLASGETEGETEMRVTCAPLIYPTLERTGARKALGEDEAAKKRMDHRSAWISEPQRLWAIISTAGRG
jgi:hypothetical protein